MRIRIYLAISLLLMISPIVQSQPPAEEETVQLERRSDLKVEDSNKQRPWSTFWFSLSIPVGLLFSVGTGNSQVENKGLSTLGFFAGVITIVSGIVGLKHIDDHTRRTNCLILTSFATLGTLITIGSTLISQSVEERNLASKVVLRNLGLFILFLAPYSIVKVGIEN